jgi:hypothetical protein
LDWGYAATDFCRAFDCGLVASFDSVFVAIFDLFLGANSCFDLCRYGVRVYFVDLYGIAENPSGVGLVVHGEQDHPSIATRPSSLSSALAKKVRTFFVSRVNRPESHGQSLLLASQ